MSAQPKYVMQPDFDKALTAFSGYVDHTVNLTKADIRREIIESEDRLRAEIQASEARLQAQIDEMKQQLDRIENVEKSNHQMLQIMLDQFSKINKKLGID